MGGLDFAAGLVIPLFAFKGLDLADLGG